MPTVSMELYFKLFLNETDFARHLDKGTHIISFSKLSHFKEIYSYIETLYFFAHHNTTKKREELKSYVV